jgi:hypothetical protein
VLVDPVKRCQQSSSSSSATAVLEFPHYLACKIKVSRGGANFCPRIGYTAIGHVRTFIVSSVLGGVSQSPQFGQASLLAALSVAAPPHGKTNATPQVAAPIHCSATTYGWQVAAGLLGGETHLLTVQQQVAQIMVITADGARSAGVVDRRVRCTEPVNPRRVPWPRAACMRRRTASGGRAVGFQMRARPAAGSARHRSPRYRPPFPSSPRVPLAALSNANRRRGQCNCNRREGTSTTSARHGSHATTTRPPAPPPRESPTRRPDTPGVRADHESRARPRPEPHIFFPSRRRTTRRQGREPEATNPVASSRAVARWLVGWSLLAPWVGVGGLLGCSRPPRALAAAFARRHAEKQYPHTPQTT